MPNEPTLDEQIAAVREMAQYAETMAASTISQSADIIEKDRLVAELSQTRADLALRDAEIERLRNTVSSDDLEACAEAAHEAWFAEKQRRGVTTWPNERGFEQMVSYGECPDDIKEFDRIVVREIIARLQAPPGTNTLEIASDTRTVEQRAWSIVHNSEWLGLYVHRYPNSKASEARKREEMAHHCVVIALKQSDAELATCRAALSGAQTHLALARDTLKTVNDGWAKKCAALEAEIGRPQAPSGATPAAALVENSTQNRAIGIVAETLLGNWPMAETVVRRLLDARLFAVDAQAGADAMETWAAIWRDFSGTFFVPDAFQVDALGRRVARAIAAAEARGRDAERLRSQAGADAMEVAKREWYSRIDKTPTVHGQIEELGKIIEAAEARGAREYIAESRRLRKQAVKAARAAGVEEGAERVRERAKKAVGEIDLMPGSTVGDLRRAWIAAIDAIRALPPKEPT